MNCYTNGVDVVIAENPEDARKVIQEVYVEDFNNDEDEDLEVFTQLDDEKVFTLLTELDDDCIPVGAKGEVLRNKAVTWSATYAQWATIGRGFLGTSEY